MWRALFLACGFFLMILGVECLGVERVTLKMRDAPPPPAPFESEARLGAQKQLIPPPWAPWTLMASGAVVCLYSITIPRRLAGK
jgi:hypothetical protein